MKKALSLLLVIITICSLTSCALLEKINGFAEKEAQCPPLIDEMMAAIAECDQGRAALLLHPTVRDEAECAGFDALCELINHRAVIKKELQAFNFYVGIHNFKKYREETLTYKITLSDEEVVYAQVIYRNDADGEGFYTFYVTTEEIVSE